MSTFVIILEFGNPPIIKHFNFVDNKTVEQIKQSLNIDDEKVLGVKTQNYIYIPKPDDIPLDLYPNLKQDISSIDTNEIEKNLNCCFIILPKSYSNDFVLIFKVETEDSLNMPPYYVRFNISEFQEKVVSDIITHVVNNFGLDILKYNISFGEKEIKDDVSFHEFISIIKTIKKQLIFKCLLGEKAIKIIVNRERLLNELYQTESTYICSINILETYFKPQISNAKILSQEKIDFIFSEIPKIIDNQRRLLQSFHSKGKEKGRINR